MKIRLALIVICFSLFSAAVFGQDNSQPIQIKEKEGKAILGNLSPNSNRLSPLTKKLLQDIKTIANKKEQEALLKRTPREYLLRNISGEVYASALIKVNSNINESELSAMNVKVGTKAGNIWTAQIPISNLENLAAIPGIEMIQIDEPVYPKLDSVRKFSAVTPVHQGYQLPKSYKGSGVVVGIIDGGFDYTHPNFADNQTSELRIKRVWEQKATTGIPPVGYPYGRELSTSTAILAAGKDSGEDSHGTHVAGIAAGGGATSNGVYTGIAPESDIVMVSYLQDTTRTSTGQSSIVDAINYIFQYAQSVGKPVVINMSLGTHIGPHDGTSLFDQACDNLVGKGKILVGSAGNEGDVKLHIKYTFSTSKEQFLTFVKFEYDDLQQGVIDSWGEVNRDYCIAIALLSGKTVVDQTYPWCPSDETETTETITGSDNKDCTVLFVTTPSEFNGKPRVTVFISNASDNMVLLAGTDNGTKAGTINLWNDGLGSGADFSAESISTIDGNSETTVGEIAGTGKNIITVGAYTTKNQFVNYFGANKTIYYPTEIGALPGYSSRGPTVDGRTKPDICAPGNSVVSSVNSFDNYYSTLGMRRDDLVFKTENGSKTWWYAVMQGTSMASPVVTGIVALMLEADPNQMPVQVKERLKNSAFTDSFTGIITQSGSNDWGWGKVNANGAVRAVLGLNNVDEVLGDYTSPLIYPNPSDGIFTIEFSNMPNGNYKIEILDILGKTVFSEMANVMTGSYGMLIDAAYLPEGVYFINILGNNTSKRCKLMISK